MYQNTPLAEVPLLVIKIISKMTSLQRWRFSSALKRSKTTLTEPARRNPRKTREISAEELGTLVRGPIWGIHSLTLRISCANPTLFLAHELK